MSKIFQIALFAAIITVVFIGLRENVIKVNAGERIKVVDGDSLEISSRRIRLLGIDSPEYVQNCYDKNHKKYSCGIKAKHYMEKLVSEGNVECREISKDRYERSLSVCYSGDINLNEEMVKSGWAVAYRDEDGRYERAESEAKKQRIGIWQGKFMRPELFRFQQRRNKG